MYFYDKKISKSTFWLMICLKNIVILIFIEPSKYFEKNTKFVEK
jgi:hypothetical protein